MSSQIVEPTPATNNVVVGAVAHLPHSHHAHHAQQEVARPVRTRERYVDWAPSCVVNEEPDRPPVHQELRFPSTRGPRRPQYERPRHVRHLEMPAASEVTGGWLHTWLQWFDWKKSLLLLGVALVTALIVSLAVRSSSTAD